ncbi:hypothetical protein DKP78_23200 [Enterococcus faecium]|nr:hypothetical protein DKP78_23200 [Enterococcus faecium]
MNTKIQLKHLLIQKRKQTPFLMKNKTTKKNKTKQEIRKRYEPITEDINLERFRSNLSWLP